MSDRKLKAYLFYAASFVAGCLFVWKANIICSAFYDPGTYHSMDWIRDQFIYLIASGAACLYLHTKGKNFLKK